MVPGRFHDLCRWLPSLAVAALCLLAALGGSESLAAWRFERRAVLEHGQWWRLLSGQFLHLGPGHLAVNLGAWLLLSAIYLPLLGALRWSLLLLVALVATAAGLLAFAPAVAWYVGLSGALHGVLAGAATLLAGRQRPLHALALLALALKLVWEGFGTGLPGMPALPDGARVVTEAHLWGALGGSFAALVWRAYAAKSAHV